LPANLSPNCITLGTLSSAWRRDRLSDPFSKLYLQNDGSPPAVQAINGRQRMAKSRLSRRVAPLAFTSSLATIGLMIGAAPALAQDEAGADAAAASAASNEIIVTAQFREQNLQDTPLAITAVNAEMLEARSQTNIAEVAAQAPSVTLKPQGTAYGPSMTASIRGIGQYDFNPALEPGVG